eukprot:GEMP01048497.1.p1 GENE.GEMP01048497.1~~GEMP01048497.1.p1  ORF type:complete len:327 (+),score=66.89 GEMP01048497.1:41-1021(+)
MVQLSTRHPDLLIGFDIGATKVRCVAFDGTYAPLGFDETSPTPATYDAFLQVIHGHVKKAEKTIGREAYFVGFAIAGYTGKDGIHVSTNLTAANGRCVRADINKLLSPRKTQLENDANCFAISEFHAYQNKFKQWGVEIASDTIVVGLILGSGVGAGIIDGDNKITHGANGFAGECGHFPLPSTAIPLMNEMKMELPRQCACKLWNCGDIFCSGRGFELLYASYFGHAARSSQEVLVSCTAGDADAIKFVDLFLSLLAHVIATIVAVVDPAVIIFGGGLGGFLPEAQLKQLAEKIDCLVLGKPPMLLPPLEGPSSGVRGAAFQRIV